MTDQQILEKIGMQNAAEALQQTTLARMRNTVELRVMGMLGDLLTHEQVNHLEEMEKQGMTKHDMFQWIGEQLVDVNELYAQTLEAYVEEFVEQQKTLGIR